MKNRTNPFVPIYRNVNNGTNKEKEAKFLSGGGKCASSIHRCRTYK